MPGIDFGVEAAEKLGLCLLTKACRSLASIGSHPPSRWTREWNPKWQLQLIRFLNAIYNDF